jgi:hypothetical protein
MDLVEMPRDQSKTRGVGLLPGQRSGLTDVRRIECLFEPALDLRA